MTRILGSSRSAIVASRRVRRPSNDGWCGRRTRPTRHHLRKERRKLPPPGCARTQAGPRPPARPRDNRGQRLIAAPRQSTPRSPLARQTRRDDHANAATPDSHPDCRCLPTQIAALQEHLVLPESRHSCPLVVPSTRRRILLVSLLTALPVGLFAGRAEAINPAETQVMLPDEIKWEVWTAGPPHSAEMAPLYGGVGKTGATVVLEER